MFQNFDTRSASGNSAERVAASASGCGQDGTRRLRRSAFGRVSERISAALRGTPCLAHRLHRLGRRSGRPRRQRRRSSSMAATHCRRRARSTPAVFRDRRPHREMPPTKWLASTLQPGDRDRLRPHDCSPSPSRAASSAPAAKPAANSLSRSQAISIDALWTDRPEPPSARSASSRSNMLAAAADKLAASGRSLAERKADAALLTLADFDRLDVQHPRRDVSHNPAPLAFARRSARRKPTLYHRRAQALATRSATISPTLPTSPSPRGLDATLLLRPRPVTVFWSIPPRRRPARPPHRRGAGRQDRRSADPMAPLKARKNAAELAGSRRAHIRDGVALTRFLAWLDREAPMACARRDHGRREAGAMPPRGGRRRRRPSSSTSPSIPSRAPDPTARSSTTG